jgi:hypothetical protein
MNEDNTNGATPPTTGAAGSTPPAAPTAGTADTGTPAAAAESAVPVLDANSIPQAPIGDVNIAPVQPTETPASAPAPAAIPTAPAAMEAPVASAQTIPTAPMVDTIGGIPSSPVATPEKKKGNNIVVVGLLIALILGLIGFIIYWMVLRKPEVASYADCVAAGYKVDASSSPQKCTTPEGKVYEQELSGTQTTTTPGASGSPTETPTESTIKVYFSKDPESYDDPTVVEGVVRTPSKADIASFALEQLILGPSAEEKALKLFTELKLSGISNCGGKDFKIETDSAAKKATITFCRPIDSPGVLSDARIKSEIEKTMNELSTVDSTVIITSSGNCFGDQSGMNTCKN